MTQALTLSSHGPSQTKLKVIPFIEAIIVIMNSDTEQDDTRGMHEMKYNQVGKLLSGIKAAGIDIMELDLQIQLFFKSLKVLISTQDALIATHWKTVRWDPQRHTRSGHTEVSIQIAAKQVNSLFERYEERLKQACMVDPSSDASPKIEELEYQESIVDVELER